LITVAIVGATVASYAVGWVLGIPVLVPLLNTAASFPFMVLALRGGDLNAAIGRMLVWALTLATCATWMSSRHPAATDLFFLRGEMYRHEMFEWVMTGRGAESTPSVFIPQQARQTAVFVALALASGSTLAMPMGAALMNSMGHYVGALAAASVHPAAAAILGWHPWAVIRIVSFVVLGVVLSMPVLSRLLRFRTDSIRARGLLGLASAGLVADVVLKWLLAPAWQRLLLRVVGW
jgi:hypothetical protein